MSATRTEIGFSIEATKAALAQLSPAQIDQVLDHTRRELEDFICTEWLPLKPNERARRDAAERFHASVRVHSFNDWRMP